MNIYARKVSDITERATLNQNGEPRNGKGNRSMRRRFLGPNLQKAGMEFLERIHQELGSRIGATDEELREEQIELHKNDLPSPKPVRPELTAEYLKSIGFANYGSW